MSNNVVAVSRLRVSPFCIRLIKRQKSEPKTKERKLRPFRSGRFSRSPPRLICPIRILLFSQVVRGVRAATVRLVRLRCLSDGRLRGFAPASRCLLLGCTRYWKLEMQKRSAPSPSASEASPGRQRASAHCSETEPRPQMQLQISKSLQITIRRSCCVFICASFMNGSARCE